METQELILAIQGENFNNSNNPNSNTSINKQPTQEEREKQAEAELKKFLEEMKNEQKNTPASQLRRLLNTNFVSPYEVMMIGPEASDEEIKKQYRQLSLLVHPDKNQDERAADAFHGNFIFK
jgi:flagellar hook-basal body complex protein FliE